MARLNPAIDRARDLLRLPGLYSRLVHAPGCPRSASALARDLLRLFFEYRTFPDNYGPCRLWEMARSEWKYYYGSNYNPHQRAALAREVQPPPYAILFQDKAVCERLCRDARLDVPLSYGTIAPRDDYRKKIAAWLEETATRTIIIKPLLGSSGRGIVVARRDGKSVVVCAASGERSLETFQLTDAAIVQEVVTQDPRLSVLSLRSLNTIRVLTMLTRDQKVLIPAALLRCGVGESYIDNWSAGGVAIGVDVQTGILGTYAHDKAGRQYVAHPTTGVRFEHFAVPEWDRIRRLAAMTQEAFPYWRLLGVDVGLRSNGTPTVVEVNGHPDLLMQEQSSGPLLLKEDVLRAFGQDGLLINRHQRQLYAHLVARDQRVVVAA